MKSLLALLVAPILAIAQSADVATTPADRNKEAWWAKRHEAKLEEAKKGPVDIVFLGDSITQGWEGGGKKVWTEKFEPLKALNLGFSGDRTEHVLWRIDNGEFDSIKPKLVVILIGTNNIGHGKSDPAQTAEGTKAILARLEKKAPDAKILLLGCFPRAEKPEDKLRVQAAEITALYKGLADGKRVHFLDISGKFIAEDGSLPKDVMPDKLHLSPKGYEIWADAMAPQIAELLK